MDAPMIEVEVPTCAACGAMSTDFIAGVHVCASRSCRATLLAETAEDAEEPCGQQTPEDLHPLVILESRLATSFEGIDLAWDEDQSLRSVWLGDLIGRLRGDLELLRDKMRERGLLESPCAGCGELTRESRMGLPLCSGDCEQKIESEAKANGTAMEVALL